MESKFFSSPPKVGSAKRGFSGVLQESPTAKRAKRAKRGKKHRSKEPKESKDATMKDSDGYTEHQDWVSFDSSPATGSPIARKQTPVKPPATFPLKQAHKAHVLKSAEKAKAGSKAETTNSEVGVDNDAKNGVKDSTVEKKNKSNSKAEANTRKTRAERKLNGEPKPFVSNGKSAIPTVAGPSKTTFDEGPVKLRELTPLSGTPPRAPVDYTFKSFPDPPSLFPSPKKEHLKDEPKANTANNKPIPVDDDTALPMQLDAAESPIPPAAFAAPAGTKTLKAINKHLKALEAKLNTGDSANQNGQVTADIESLRTDITRLHERLDRDELRAAIRHEMLFNALVKVSTDIGLLNSQVQAIQQQQDSHIQGHDGADGENTAAIAGENGATPRTKTNNTAGGGAASAGSRDKDKDRDRENDKGKDAKDRLSKSKSIAMQQSRKTLEQCLRIYTEDMNRAGGREEVAKYGRLCLQYAGDLFKTLG